MNTNPLVLAAALVFCAGSSVRAQRAAVPGFDGMMESIIDKTSKAARASALEAHVDAELRRLGFARHRCASRAYMMYVGSGCAHARPSGIVERIIGTPSPFADGSRCARLILRSDYDAPSRTFAGKLRIEGFLDGNHQEIELARYFPENEALSAGLPDLERLVRELRARYGESPPTVEDDPRLSCPSSRWPDSSDRY